MSDEEKVMIVMTSGPDTPRRCATPFFMAITAAALDKEVVMFFTIDGTLLLKKGMAETIVPKEGGQPVSFYLEQAIDLDIKFYACSASTELHGIDASDLIEGVTMAGGAKLWEIAEDCETVLTF